MASRRRGEGGFRRIGEGGIRDLDLHARLAKPLELQWAWRRTAGEAIARRAPVIGVRRGVLEIEAADARWVEALRTLIPGLAARLAADFPELGVKRFRLIESDRTRR